MAQWDYLEVELNAEKRSWKDSQGRSGKLKKGGLVAALNGLGTEGWELAGSLGTDSATSSRLFFKRPRPAAPELPVAE